MSVYVDSGQTDSFVLKNEDRVYVRQDPNFLDQQTVTISGQVKYPGSYTLLHHGERLSSLIERAGGLREGAFPEGVRFVRRQSPASDVAVDLTRALDGDVDYDIVLMPNDEVRIPLRDLTVRVEGAVLYPRLVQYVPGKKADYYIQACCGITTDERAAKRGTHIVRANGFVMRAYNRWGADPKVPPGSTIVVPEVVDGVPSRPKATPTQSTE